MTKEPPRPTPAELEILGVLWELGPSTVREIQEDLDRRRPTGYTTVLKLLQIMTDKGIVRRDVRERAHRYAAKLPREKTEQQMVGDLVDRAFGGSASRLVMRALSTRPATADEVARIRELLDEIEGEKE
ncbi:MAG TPA: BlaI/MecI/CopY family transcriptional regulator [Thermoanaerobaculia bacterium]|jgi:predicted transcriptional regulator|nr:BlaI/MecI/CopY family transcriptional regulator [Thermoanaerobaculia bacterium]